MMDRRKFTKRLRNARILSAVLCSMLMLSNISLYAFAENDGSGEYEIIEDVVEEGDNGDEALVEEVFEEEGTPASGESSRGSEGSVPEEIVPETEGEGFSDGEEVVEEVIDGEEEEEDEVIEEDEEDDTVSDNDAVSGNDAEEIVEEEVAEEEGESLPEETEEEVVSEEDGIGDIIETVSDEGLITDASEGEFSEDNEADLSLAVESSTDLISVNIDGSYNITAAFKITAGSKQIRLKNLKASLYSFESTPAYDPVTREIQTDSGKYSFNVAKSDIVEPGETDDFTVTIPSSAIDSKGSGLTITDAISEKRMHVTLGTATDVLDSLGNLEKSEYQEYYIGTLYDPGSDGVRQKNYTLKSAKYDGMSHSLVYSKKLKADEQVLYSSDGKNWSDVPLSYKEIGTYTSYYMIVNSSTGSEVKWGTLTMKIKKGSADKLKHHDVSYYYNKAAKKNAVAKKVVVSGNKTKRKASGTKKVTVKKIIKRSSKAPKTGDSLPAFWLWFSFFITGLSLIGLSSVEVPSYAVSGAGYGSVGAFSGVERRWNRRNDSQMYRALVRMCAKAVIFCESASKRIETCVTDTKKRAYKGLVHVCALIIVKSQRFFG